MKYLPIIILILSILDLTATYFYVFTFNQKFPKLDYTTLEANPILKASWKLFGLKTGMIIGGIVVFAILTLIVFTISDNWRYYLAGVFTMMLVYHFLNFTQLANLKPAT